MILNPYKIFWAIAVKNNKIADYKHGNSKKAALKNLKPSLGSKVYIITDKQFGYIQNSFTSEFAKNITPLKNTLKLENYAGFKMTVPLTSKQFNNPIQY